MENYLSLYEYLGKAAGSTLGQQVADAAKRENIEITSHHVENPKYSGLILKYPKSFLDRYFGNHTTPDSKGAESMGSVFDDELPF